MKKLLTLSTLAAVTALVATSASAGCGDKAYKLAGLYGGVQFGPAWADTEVKTTPLMAGAFKNKYEIASRGVIGGIHLGWGRLVGANQNFYTGLELSGDWTSLKGEAKTGNDDALGTHKINVELKDAADLALRLGRVFDGSLAYVKLGGSYGRWEISTRTSINGHLIQNSKKNRFGWLVGLGFERPVADKVAVGAEVNYTHYDKFTFKNPDVVEYRVQPKLATLKLFAKYKFK